MEVTDFLVELIKRGGSDLHITVGVPPMIRKSGKLVPLEAPKLTPRDTRALIYSILSEEQRMKLETDWEHDFAYSIPGKARFRINVFYQRSSISAAFRLIPMEIRTLEELGMPSAVGEFCKRPRGLILVTGPTGCGKSTTCASMIDVINGTRSGHIITIEDPIEYLHKHKKSVVNQREIDTDTKSFAGALKYTLRQDPDVILIGEMRDTETTATALTAAETGHLVLASLHTQDAPQTIDRVVDIFPPHQQQQIRVQLAGSLQGIVSQQLLPSVRGDRVAAAEVLVVTPAVRNLVREMKTHQIYNAMETGIKHGMHTMDQALAALLRRGAIGRMDALDRAVDPANLKRFLNEAA
ncbi:MAG: type IV pilus twitching motility protein PilT [Terriglobia bacterium]